MAIITDKDRAAARAEAEADRESNKMSSTTAMRLRARNETDRVERIDNLRFANALRSVVINDVNLCKLVSRLSTDQTHIERKAVKLAWFLNNTSATLGDQHLGTPEDIVALINLTPDEMRMTDNQFAAVWKAKKVVTVPCANKACGRGERLARARVQKTGDTCCRDCREMVKAVLARAAKQSEGQFTPA